jgi:hypothetical protein
LKPPPTGRLRRAHLHLPYGMTLSRLLDTTRSSNRTCSFPASGFRTRWLMLSPTHDTRRACHGSLRHLLPSGTAERFLEVARLTPIARALAPSDLTLEPRSLRSTIITRFTTVGSEEAHLAVLTSVRHSNCTCSFPACSFHADALARAAREGIRWTRSPSPLPDPPKNGPSLRPPG